MKVGYQRVTICFLLMASLLLSACGSIELFDPTATSTPTSTLTHTPTPMATSTPTLTRTPMPTRDPRKINSENQHLYLYVADGRRWHNASDYCLSRGGYLVSIESASENDFVYNLSSGGNTWLGATDEIKERTLVWASGQSFDFKYWDEGEPNNCCPPQNCGREGCTPEHYLTFSGHGKTWNDVPDGTMSFTCEWETASP